MKILGISLGHDTNFCLVENGKIKEICEVERYYRQKRYKLHCEQLAEGTTISGYQYVDVKELKEYLNRLQQKWGSRFDAVAVQNQGRDQEFQNLQIIMNEVGFETQNYISVNHHLSHAALAFYTSPFDKALILSFDGAGNDGFTIFFHADGKDGISYRSKYEERLGQAYNNLGFIVGVTPDVSGTTSGKTMGLAAYGRSNSDWLPYAEKYVRNYRKIKGSPLEGLSDYGKSHVINSVGLEEIRELENYLTPPITSKGLLGRLLGNKKEEVQREMKLPGPDDRVSQQLAETVQTAWSNVVINLVEKNKGSYENFCIVGGCALNGVTNYEIQNRGWFKNLHFVPNPTDCGLAAGAALKVYYDISGDVFNGYGEYYSPYLGEEVYDKDQLAKLQTIYPNKEVNCNDTMRILAKAIAKGFIIGVIRGRYEIGPRALGNRSILCNPLDPNMRDILNDKVKHREWYRPFAPVCSAEDADMYFTSTTDIPYMSIICHTREEYRNKLPSITHIDGTCRLQTVNAEQNRFLYETIKEFEKITGHPVLLNTSFNPGGEPILNYYFVGLEMLEKTKMDIVLIEDCFFVRPGNESIFGLFLDQP